MTMKRKGKFRSHEKGQLATGRYIPPVLGKPIEVLQCTQVPLQDTVKKGMTEQAAEYVDSNPVEQ